MTGRERIKAILDNKPADKVGFWAGVPVEETRSIFFKHFGVNDDQSLSLKLGNDFMSVEADWLAWKHPEGKPMFDFTGGEKRLSLNHPGVFAECDDVREVEAFDWPNPDYLDFSPVIETADSVHAKGMAVFGGMWSMFFHDVSNFFGMENYFIKMHTDPDVVEAVTEKVVGFYLEANKRCFDALADKIDAFFFGNDFGTQEDLIISPEAFKKFVLPGITKLIGLAKSYNLKVVLHSCGAISRVIPLLIDAGIDALHPLQAKAKGMEAEKIAAEYKNHLAFIGGVDTQDLLPYGSPNQIKDEVRRLKRIFGGRYVVSPSHEAILPNVSIENIIALRDAAYE